ncbi:hypothetical protein K2173_011595 [Erythroxylum novogranatense]|uniref:Glycosyltransferase n=1 Tax=Erythroxylum novogranatense TaxID=1862640 RepID=A0AAV8U626_9ROSI|nr:hypothetical protein K2173_011595 [Erythroxylum novogranatense]
MPHPHVLLLSYPSQGHINPALHFAKRLVASGVHVTFATSIGGDRCMIKTTTAKALSFATFSDGYDEGFKQGAGRDQYMVELKRRGSETVAQLILGASKTGDPFTFVVYCTLLPWAAKVAREYQLPSVLFWNQPAIVFAVYYYYFNGYGDYIKEKVDDPEFSLKLPGLPSLSRLDLPYFFMPWNNYPFALPLFKEHLDVLDEETDPKVLVNTFDALECETLNSIDKYKLIGIGPLIPSAFLGGKDLSDRSFGGDLFQGSKGCVEWLNLKSESSVIYIAFGSISMLSKPQLGEMARALVDMDSPFLWVVRENEREEDKLSCRDALKELGMVVPWCSQVEVLSHKAIGCFLMHCGWNSTLESLAFGVPVVAFPQWADQFTNTQLIESVCKTGVRLKANEDGVVESEEIKRCLELVMGGGEEGNEIRRNAKRWKALATEASKEGSSSEQNIMAFLNEVRGAQ